MAPEPWDMMYISYLESQMDYANAEYGRYNNTAAMFQAEYDGFANWYNRTHTPKGTRIRYFSEETMKLPSLSEISRSE